MSAGVIAASSAPVDFSAMVLALAPLAYWKFDTAAINGTNQTAVDSSGNGHTGTQEFMNYNQSPIVAGTTPGATISNVDNSSRVYAAHSSWMDVSAMTALTIHRPSLASTGYIMAIDDGGSGNAEMSWNVLRINDGSLQLVWRNAAGSVVGITSPVGLWPVRVGQVISASLSAAGAALYLDGVLVASGAGQAPRVGTGMLRVANLNGTGFPGTGWYDEYAYFGSHLSAADHLALAEAAHGADRTPNTGSDGTVWRMNPEAVLGQTKLYSSSTGTAVVTGGNGNIARTRTVPALFKSGANPHSIELWFTKPAAAVHGSLFKIDDAIGSGGWGVGLGGSLAGDNDGHVLLFVREKVAWGPDITTLATGTHHLVATRNGTNFKVYLDATLIYNSNPGTISEAVNGGFSVGGYLTTRMLPPTVPIDKFSTYNVELTSTRVAAHYNGGAGSDAAVAADSPLTLLELDRRS